MRFNIGEVICREGLAFPEGALVCDGYDGMGQLLAHPVGGGLQLTVPVQEEPLFQRVGDAERAAALFHLGRFSLADSEGVFTGWSNGRLWNGWEMPRFGKAEAERLLAWVGDERAHFDEKRDAFVSVNQDGEEEVWSGEVITITDGSGIKVYPVGAGAWIWEEA